MCLKIFSVVSFIQHKFIKSYIVPDPLVIAVKKKLLPPIRQLLGRDQQ